MKIADWFKSNTHKAAGDLDQLTREALANLEHQQGLNNLEDALERASANGEISEEEAARLKALMKQHGLDPNELADVMRTTDGKIDADDFADQLRDQLREARNNASEDEAFLNFRIQVASDEYTSNYNAASAATNAEHKALMNVISNLKA